MIKYFSTFMCTQFYSFSSAMLLLHNSAWFKFCSWERFLPACSLPHYHCPTTIRIISSAFRDSLKFLREKKSICSWPRVVLFSSCVSVQFYSFVFQQLTKKARVCRWSIWFCEYVFFLLYKEQPPFPQPCLSQHPSYNSRNHSFMFTLNRKTNLGWTFILNLSCSSL